jgi:hypothetical protein
MPQLQVAKTEGKNIMQKVDNTLKMESHARKFEVLPSTKMLPCATIYQIKRSRNPILGTSWLPLEFQTHSITSNKKLSAPYSWKSTQASKYF